MVGRSDKDIECHSCNMIIGLLALQVLFSVSLVAAAAVGYSSSRNVSALKPMVLTCGQLTPPRYDSALRVSI